jgi:threonine dehydratase
MTVTVDSLSISTAQFREAHKWVSAHAHHTPMLHSRLLNERTGFDVRLKAEMFQRTGSYKLRGPLNKLRLLSDEQKKAGVICSSAGNHAQGLALAASIYGIKAVVVMATNATPSKIEATKAYGAEVILHGKIWDEANEKAKELVTTHGYTYIHPFDDLELITGQGTLGLELYDDFPEVEVAVVPIGGGGLISGVSMALKGLNPNIRVIGVESSGAPGMRDSVAAGKLVALTEIDCIIDGLRVMRVGEKTFGIVQRYVDEVVALPDAEIFEAMRWTMGAMKIVPEGAAAAPIAALLAGLVKAKPGTKVACVLSGGNLNLDQLRGLRWN